MPWHSRQVTPEPPPDRPAPWQIWQEANPELPGFRFAAAPWFCGAVQSATGPWWHPAVFEKQETFEIPPERSAPWHSAQEPALPVSA